MTKTQIHAEIIAIGDEIASGQLLDTNSQTLSRRLESMGVRVLYHSTVGDALEPCAEVFRRALDRAGLVLATGGLGPTDDDLTREALALATGRPLVPNPAALEHIGRLFARRGRPMLPRNEKQALFPEGSRMIHNPNGTAPGIDLLVPRPGREPSRFLALPGVPAEIDEMWRDSVRRTVLEFAGGDRVILHRAIKCFGAGESQIEAMLPGLIHRGRYPLVGINASKTTIILRLTADGTTADEARAAMEPTIATIRQCLGHLIFGEGDDELQDVVGRLLRARRATLATVEWGTAGLVADWLGQTPEGKGHYLGGLVVQNEQAAARALNLPGDFFECHTAASSEAAQAMAVQCRSLFGADYALAVGALPEANPGASPPENAFLALAAPGGMHVRPQPLAGHPAVMTTFCAKTALNLARLALLE